MRVALLRPELNPAQVSEVLGRLRNGLWYLRYRDRRYFFTARPNLNKAILDFEQGISDEQVEESLRESLLKVAGQGKSELQVLVAPPDEEAVAEPSRATLVLLPWPLGETESAREWMKRVVHRITRRNLLAFLAPEKGREGALRVAGRRWLALKNLQQSQTFRELDREDQEEVKRLAREKEDEIHGLLLGMYQRLFRPGGEDVEELRVTLRRDGKTLAEMVAAALRERGILLESLSPEYLAATFRPEERPVSLAEVQTVLTGSPGQPLLVEPQKAISYAVREGVAQGKFGVKAGDRTFTEEVPDGVLERSDVLLIPREEIPPKAEPVSGAVAQLLRVTGGGRNLYPVRQLLERLQGTEVTLHLTIEDPTGKLASKRREVEQLLEDYGVAYEWNEAETSPGPLL